MPADDKWIGRSANAIAARTDAKDKGDYAPFFNIEQRLLDPPDLTS